MTTKRNNEYGLQPRHAQTFPPDHIDYSPAAGEARRIAYEKARWPTPEAKFKEALAEEVDFVAGMLEARDSRVMRQIESIGWEALPYNKSPYEGRPKVNRVSIRGLGGMALEEAVRKGILSMKGFHDEAYRRELALMNGHTLPPHSEHDEHGFPLD